MSRLDEQLNAELEQARADGLYRQLRTVASAQGPRVVIAGRKFLNFSSNDYLGLANDPVLKRAATAAIKKYGVGAGASRLVSGNLAPYDELEAKLARFKKKEAAIVFGSGYAANVGTITALVGDGDAVILDKLDHASIIDGARQSGATVRVYPHGNLKKLEELLRQTQEARRRLVVTESVFSMDGDRAPLTEIVALKEKYDAWLMVDEAHATGVFGKHRRGLAEELGVEAQVDVMLGTLSKALGCAGGFVAGSRTLVDFLRNRARSLIYSTALPPSVVAAASAAVDLVMSAEGRRRQQRLWKNVREAGRGVDAAPTGPILPVIVGDESAAVALSRRLYEQGIFVPAIRYPTVAKGKARLRVTVTAGHTAEDVGRLVAVLGRSRMQSAPTAGGDFGSKVVVGAVSNRDPKQSRPHSAVLRRGRISLPDECYFITTCVARKQPLLKDEAARVVIEALRWLRDEGRVRLLGFVVMPDHLHVALALREDWTLPQVMHSLKRHSSRQIHLLPGVSSVAVGADCIRDCSGKGVAVENRSHNHPESSGALWQDGYHDNLLRERRDFEKRLEYMHDNPRRSGLVERAEEYPFSTAHPDYVQEIDWEWIEGVAVENRSHRKES